MGLTPLLSVSIVKLQSKDSLSELAHHIYPKKSINILIFKAEESVDFWQSAEIESASVSSALFITSREGAELSIPCLTLFVAAFELVTTHRVSVRLTATIGISIDELADTMAEELMTSNMHLVAFE